jgi:glycosyltransferase involved in cell wall biosynthesis
MVGNGVDTKEYFFSIQDSEREGVGSIFGWSKAKDPDSIIEIMQMLGRRLPGVSRYLFSNGKKPNGIEGVSFKRLPTVETARRIYSSRKVWFLSSFSEGCPNPLLEAMACGCAVVSTDCGGPSDIIKDGVNGFLAQVGDTETMVDKIVLLYRDEQLRNRICANAMKTVKKFSWPKAVDKLESYLITIYDNEHR